MNYVDVLLFVVPIATLLIFLLISLIGRLATRYRIFERRLDITSGIFRRKTDSIWFYEIIDITFQQPLFLMICGTGEIVVQTDKRKYRIRAIQPSRKMLSLWEKMRDAVVSQRRDIKGVWL